MSQQWGESFGGPPGVPVVRHGNGPQVRLKYDRDCTGRVMREGPAQSIVRWRNGNEDCVCNDWIERVRDGSTNAVEATGTEPPEGAGSEAVPPIKPRKEPDALARRVSEFDDAELKAFALNNGVWDDKYLKLPNPGLRRMNVLNRLRARLKREPEYEIRW